MLKLDVNKLPEQDIKRIVTERCAAHGDVSNVIICDPTPVVGYKLAFVRMADPSRLGRLVNAFEAIRVNGAAAIIRLDPLRWMMGSDGVLARR
jgi:hypothetical protein